MVLGRKDLYFYRDQWISFPSAWLVIYAVLENHLFGYRHKIVANEKNKQTNRPMRREREGKRREKKVIEMRK